MKKYLGLIFLITISFLYGQNYYPKLNNYLMSDDASILKANPEYAKFAVELQRVTSKLFYKNFQFSGDENTSIFYSMQLIPKKDSVENVFNSSITLVFDKSSNLIAEGIPLTYQQTKNASKKELSSSMVLDKGGVYLVFSEKLFRPNMLKKNILKYNITRINTEIKDGVAQFNLIGSFPEEIKLKKSPTQEITEIQLVVIQNKVRLQVPYHDRKKEGKLWTLYEADFNGNTDQNSSQK